MTQQQTHQTLGEVLQQLDQQGFSTDRQTIEALLEQKEANSTPIYINVLIAIGAALATFFCFIFICGFTFIYLFQEPAALAPLGFIVLGAGILMKRSNPSGHFSNQFVSQISVVSVLTGKIALVGGIWLQFEDMWVTAGGAVIVAAATYHIYPVWIERFLSVLGALFVLRMAIGLEHSHLEIFSVFETLIYNIILFAGAGYLLFMVKDRIRFEPVLYAVVISLCVGVAAASLWSNQWLHRFDDNETALQWLNYANKFTSIGISVCLVLLYGWAAGGLDKLKTPALMTASACTLIFGVISVPGILLAIGLLVLGFAKYDRILSGIGVVFLGIFLWEFYYMLSVTLFDKSIILIASGALLLLGRFIMSVKNWDKGAL